MTRAKHHFIYKKMVLIFLTIFIPFLLLEVGYRITKPYPYYGHNIAKEQVYFDRYDPILGWSGIPGIKGWIYTRNNLVHFENNSLGFRDIEHDKLSNKPAIVFLGASYVWGYDTSTDKIFVNLLRDRLSQYEIFNLSNVCYGTDQELLIFENWLDKFDQQLKLVVLLFTIDDPERNSSTMCCDRGKPKFKIINDNLVLTGVPVPKAGEWLKNTTPIADKTKSKYQVDTLKSSIKTIIFKSYILHALYDRYARFRNRDVTVAKTPDVMPERYQATKEDLILTSKLLEKIKSTAKSRGGEFIVFFLPPYPEIDEDKNYNPYQYEISKLCAKIAIDCYDLAPYFKKAWWRTHNNDGTHWNNYGNEIAAEAIFDVIKNEEMLNLEPYNTRNH